MFESLSQRKAFLHLSVLQSALKVTFGKSKRGKWNTNKVEEGRQQVSQVTMQQRLHASSGWLPTKARRIPQDTFGFTFYFWDLAVAWQVYHYLASQHFFKKAPVIKRSVLCFKGILR